MALTSSDPLALRGVRAECEGRLRVLFCPGTKTELPPARVPEALAEADEVVFVPQAMAADGEGATAEVADSYLAHRTLGVPFPRLFMARNRLEAWEHVMNSEVEGDAVVSLGAGEPPLQKPLRRRIWIGQGSNMWKPDLNLGIDYVKTSGPAGMAGAKLGIPWMAGIPGTVGGWVKMNAGAFGHSVSELVEAVNVDGRWIAAADCGFGYRTSAICGEIRDVRWKRFRAADYEPAEAYLARRAKFPSGTFGSFFKNPAGDYAGRLLEAAGAKELRVGGAFVWKDHANVIVRGKGATPSDVLALARLMRRLVRLRFGVLLEAEVRGIEF